MLDTKRAVGKDRSISSCYTLVGMNEEINRAMGKKYSGRTGIKLSLEVLLWNFLRGIWVG